MRDDDACSTESVLAAVPLAKERGNSRNRSETAGEAGIEPVVITRDGLREVLLRVCVDGTLPRISWVRTQFKLREILAEIEHFGTVRTSN